MKIWEHACSRCVTTCCRQDQDEPFRDACDICLTLPKSLTDHCLLQTLVLKPQPFKNVLIPQMMTQDRITVSWNVTTL